MNVNSAGPNMEKFSVLFIFVKPVSFVLYNSFFFIYPFIEVTWHDISLEILDTGIKWQAKIIFTTFGLVVSSQNLSI